MHIVLEKTKIDKIRIEGGGRAVRYEKRTMKVNKIIQECWREIDMKRENRMSKWEEIRIRDILQRERQDLTERWTVDNSLDEILTQADKTEQPQKQYERIIRKNKWKIQ